MGELGEHSLGVVGATIFTGNELQPYPWRKLVIPLVERRSDALTLVVDGHHDLQFRCCPVLVDHVAAASLSLASHASVQALLPFHEKAFEINLHIVEAAIGTVPLK